MSDQSNTSAFSGNIQKNNNWVKKSPLKCHNCGKYGHIKKFCHFKRQTNEFSTEERSKHVAFLVNNRQTVQQDEIFWSIDSGATGHIDCGFSKLYLRGAPRKAVRT